MTADVKKRGLGRGLDALFLDAKYEETAFQAKQPENMPEPQSGLTGQLPRKLSIDRLTPGKYQPRRHFDENALDQLSDSIAAHGILQPLLVRPLSNSMYEIIAGERRWRAAQRAQIHEVPVVIQDLSDGDALEIALIENLQREDLTALEEADGYQRLMDEFGHTQDKLAEQLGKSRSHVANTLRLLKLPAGIKKYIQDGRLSAGHARALIGAADPETLAEMIVTQGLSVRQVEKLMQKTPSGKTAPKKIPGFKQKDIDILALEEKMSSLLGMRVTIDGVGAAGKISVEYKSLDQLDDVLARLSSTPKS